MLNRIKKCHKMEFKQFYNTITTYFKMFLLLTKIAVHNKIIAMHTLGNTATVYYGFLKRL